jgi:hypothetical protein
LNSDSSVIVGDLAQRTHLDSRRVHVDRERGDALALRRVGIGPGQAPSPVGELGVARPHLLTIHDESAIDFRGTRRQRGEVAPRAGFAEQLAPDLGCVEDARQPPRLLLRGAVREQRGPDEVHADAADELRSAGPRELLGHDVVLYGAATATAVLPGPRDADEPAARELRLPPATERDLLGQVVETRRQALAVLPRKVRAQPVAYFVA